MTGTMRGGWEPVRTRRLPQPWKWATNFLRARSRRTEALDWRKWSLSALIVKLPAALLATPIPRLTSPRKAPGILRAAIVDGDFGGRYRTLVCCGYGGTAGRRIDL